MEIIKQFPLFGEIPITVITRTERSSMREKVMKKALDKQSEAFKSAFRLFTIEFVKHHDIFLIEDIRFEYLKTNLPKPYSKNPKDAWKSIGGLIHGLIKEGILEHYTVDGKRQFRYSLGGERQMAVYRGKQ